jgi:hypothetical protein
MEVQVLGSGTDGGGGGGGDDSVARLPEKEVVTVPSVSNCWKLSFKGIVKTPEIAMVLPVRLSCSTPDRLNVAVAVVADVFWKSNGDCVGTSGVHTWPPAAGLAEQPGVPSIPGSRSVSVIAMFGAAENVIKAGTFRDPGGLVISAIVPVVPSRAMKLPCWELAGELIENRWLAPKAMLPGKRLAVPVIFRTPVSRSALAVRGISMNAIKLIIAILFVKVPPMRKSGSAPCLLRRQIPVHI